MMSLALSIMLLPPPPPLPLNPLPYPLTLYACRFAHTSLRLSDLLKKAGGHFDTYWLVNVAESLLGENRIVIWLCKIALAQYQLSLHCNVKAHYSWPICSTWQIAIHASVCTFHLDPLSHGSHSWFTTASLSVSAVCFECDWFCCLKYKMESGVTLNIWDIMTSLCCSTVQRCTESCLPTGRDKLVCQQHIEITPAAQTL